MLTANLNESRVYADECVDRKADYRCPECGERLILARGSVKIPHFKHEAHTACEYSGETMDHLRAKAWLYRTLKRNPFVECVEAECSRWEGIRPDVAFCINGHWTGIEVQHSGISEEEIKERCYLYDRNDVHIMWCATEKLYNKICESDEVRLSAQARLFFGLHGSLFIFTGESLLAFTFRNVVRTREGYNYYDGYTGEFWEETLKTVFTPQYVAQVFLEDERITDLQHHHAEIHLHPRFDAFYTVVLANLIGFTPRQKWDDWEYWFDTDDEGEAE